MPFGLPFTSSPSSSAQLSSSNQPQSSRNNQSSNNDLHEAFVLTYSDDDDDDDDDEDPFQDQTTASLLGKHRSSSAIPESIPLKSMYAPPTLRRSHSSKRIFRRDSDSEEEREDEETGITGRPQSDSPTQEDATGDGTGSTRGPRLPSTRRKASGKKRRSFRQASLSLQREASSGGHLPISEEDGVNTEGEDEPKWSKGFDESRSARENKSLAISAELDAMGMGRYQWFIFGLCGLGFFIDLLWAQMFGLITVPLRNQAGFGAEDGNIGTLSTAFNVGLTVGAFSWGIGVDVLGRRWSFYLTCLFAGVFGLASGAPPTFTGLRVLCAFVGFGVGGNIPIDCTITLEFLPTDRHFLLALLSVFQPIGTLVATGIAYAFIPRYSCGGGDAELSGAEVSTCTNDENMGWRYSLYTIGGITLLVFFIRFLVFNFRESPAYLINRGDDEEAIQVLYSIAETNKAAKPRLTMDDFKMIEQLCAKERRRLRAEREQASSGDSPNFSVDGPQKTTSSEDAGQAHLITNQPNRRNSNLMDHEREIEVAGEHETAWQTVTRTLRDAGHQLMGVKILFRNRTMGRITILLWLTYMADFFGFNIAGVFLPLILADRGVAAGQTLSETYRDYVAIYAPGIVACLLACCLIEVPRVGRQYVMVISSALMAISFFVYTKVTTEAGSVGLNAMEYFFQSLFNAVLYAVVPEFYPSAVRGTAAGLTSTLGRISGIIAPIAGQSLYSANGETADGATKVLYLGGAVTLLCPIALLLLPYDTRGKRSY